MLLVGAQSPKGVGLSYASNQRMLSRMVWGIIEMLERFNYYHSHRSKNFRSGHKL